VVDLRLDGFVHGWTGTRVKRRTDIMDSGEVRIIIVIIVYEIAFTLHFIHQTKAGDFTSYHNSQVPGIPTNGTVRYR